MLNSCSVDNRTTCLWLHFSGLHDLSLGLNCLPALITFDPRLLYKVPSRVTTTENFSTEEMLQNALFEHEISVPKGSLLDKKLALPRFHFLLRATQDANLMPRKLTPDQEAIIGPQHIHSHFRVNMESSLPYGSVLTAPPQVNFQRPCTISPRSTKVFTLSLGLGLFTACTFAQEAHVHGLIYNRERLAR